MKSIRKLSNFNFQWTKTLYQNNFKHSAFFFTLFKGYKCNKLYEITPKKRFLSEPEKTNFKSLKFHKLMKSICMTMFSQFLYLFSLAPISFGVISRNLSHLKPLKSVKNNAISLTIFWYKMFATENYNYSISRWILS